MNIRKHWKNLLLTTTAFFWAGCNGDSVTESGCPCDNDSGIESSSRAPSNLVLASANPVPAKQSHLQVQNRLVQAKAFRQAPAQAK